MKRAIVAFLCGVGSVFAYAYHQPDQVAEFGIKLAAFQAAYAVDAYPREIHMQEAAYIEPEKPKGKKR